MYLVTMSIYISNKEHSGHLYWNSNKKGKGFSKSMLKNHSRGNKQINGDFCNIILSNEQYKNMNIFENQNCLEIGCGTGDFSDLIYKKLKCKSITGLDISENAIQFANKKYKNENVNFMVFDCLQNNFDKFKNIDITICSNTLEHFRNPYILINKMLQISKQCLILVPFNQPCTDGYSGEGGAGHVFQFTMESFNNYDIKNTIIFKTNGWSYSSKGEIPQQLAIIIQKK